MPKKAKELSAIAISKLKAEAAACLCALMAWLEWHGFNQLPVRS
jgi:hypothetical protein